VLDAAGISAEAGYRDGWWLLVVDHDDLAISAAELNAYHRENPVQPHRRSKKVPIYAGAAMGVFVYAAVLILIAVLTAQWAFGLEWLPAGRMQAGKVMAGEWWRVVTALTLHLDAGHITANLVFGAVFGFLAGQALGGGVAWLAIVVAGALGNLINAFVQAPTHSSIGASTAVFAALGVIVSHALRHWGAVREKPLRRWSPLIGGVILLAYTGSGGERTDVVAHLTGFLAGLVIGWVGCRLPPKWLASSTLQKWAGLATIALIVTAWVVGLALFKGSSE
jgi:membrane associated rhomboid family serine protease